MISFGKSKQKSSSNPVDLTPEAFKNLQQPFADVLAQLIGGGDTGTVQGGVPIAEGPFAAPVSGGEQTLLDQLLAKAGGATSTSQDLLGQTIQGDFLTENPFLQSQIEIAQVAPVSKVPLALANLCAGRSQSATEGTDSL